MKSIFIKLTRPDGLPVWIAANTIVRVTPPGKQPDEVHSTVHFDDNDMQLVKEDAEIIIRMIEEGVPW